MCVTEWLKKVEEIDKGKVPISPAADLDLKELLK
jgi:hypothetical protein